MQFYNITGRGDFASYTCEQATGEIHEPRIITPHRQIHGDGLAEYLGEPARKPRKKGDFHSTASSYYLKAGALGLIFDASSGKLLSHPVLIEGREQETFEQVWILNFVNCLDVEKTVAGPPGGYWKGKIGVIKHAVFDESRWDGSDLFVVPEDPSYNLFCTERFISQWKAAKFRGIQFSRFLFDPDAILC